MKKDSFDEGTFQMAGKKVYNYISEERIRQMEKEDEDYWNRVWKKKERF